MNNNKSPHILNTSSNLLGFCFIVLTSLKLMDREQQLIIDEVMAIAALIFMTSSILSFLSIRSKNTIRSHRYETFADYFFITGMIILFIVILVVAFNINDSLTKFLKYLFPDVM